MPELPEVETTIRYLRPALKGTIISNLTASEKGRSHFSPSFPVMKDKIVGTRISKIKRVGKWILLDLDTEKVVSHLRMSGRYKLDKDIAKHKHNRFQLHLGNGIVANYIDQRRFGTFHLIDGKEFSHYPSLQKLGPDAVNDAISAEYLANTLRNRSISIYQALLDQSVIAGLGNIYVNEILHDINLHPASPANQVSRETLSRIITSMKRILAQAINFKGTTLIDDLYKSPEDESGEFAQMLKVYGKTDDPNITRLKIGGRTAFVHTDTPEPAKTS